MPARTVLTLTDREMDEIEDAAAVASKAVAHLHITPDYRTFRCGHRYGTACDDFRCTLIASPFM